MPRLWIGTSGFSYREWQGEGLFYPPKLPAKRYFSFYSERYPSVEVDGSWYRMPGKPMISSWNTEAPEAFRFCFKCHRQVTHLSRLKLEGIDSLKFMLGRLYPLAASNRLGPLLVQLPPNMKRDDERLDAFLNEAPQTIRDPDDPNSKAMPVTLAFEFRNVAWRNDVTLERLRQHGAIWVGADTDDQDADRIDLGGPHYVRLRKTNYDAEALAGWARYLYESGRDAYVFCKHEDAERPWDWADELRRAYQALGGEV